MNEPPPPFASSERSESRGLARKRRLIVGVLVLALAPLGTVATWKLRTGAPVPTRTLPALDALVTIPVSTTSEVLPRVTIDVKPGFVRVSEVERAPWAGLELRHGPESLDLRSTGARPADTRVSLLVRPDKGLAIQSDDEGRILAMRDRGAPLGPVAAALRAGLRLDPGGSLTVDSDERAPMDAVALLVALAAERSVFMDFLTRPKAEPAPASLVEGLRAARRAGCEAIRIRADARTSWSSVAGVIEAALAEGIYRYTFVVGVDGDERDLVSAAKQPPVRIFFPDADTPELRDK